MTSDIQATTLKDILRIIFKHKAIILIPIIPAMIVTYVVFELVTPVYTARVKMMVLGRKVTEAPHYKEMLKSESDTVSDIVPFVTSNTVLERVVKALKLYEIPPDYERRFASPLKRALIEYQLKKYKKGREIGGQGQTVSIEDAIARLEGNVRVSSEPFEIIVSDLSPAMAVRIANSVSRSYVIFDLEMQISELKYMYGEKHEKIVLLKKYIEDFKKYLDGNPLPDLEAMGPSGIKIVEQAKNAMPPAEITSRRIRIQLISFFLSIALGLTLAIVIEFFDPTFKSPRDIETFLNIPCLGFIPKRKFKGKKQNGENNPDTDIVHLYGKLTEQVILLMKDKNIKCILMTGAESSEDIASIIAGIGTYAARKGDKRVLIIDANLRDPSMFKILNITSSPSLGDVLKGDASLDNAVQNLEPNLYILPSDETAYNPTTLLSLQGMGDIIRSAKENYDIVLLSSASVKDFTDAVKLSSLVDGSILVINEGKTKRPVLRVAIDSLVQKKDHLLGAILNNRTFIIPKWIYERI